MAGVQRVTIIGHVGKEPEILTPNGTTLAKFPVAVSESYKNKQGEKVDSTEWFNVEIWGKLAEVAGKYVKKGSLLYLEGKQKTDVYEKDGVRHSRVKLVANSMTMLGSKNSDSDSYSGGYQNRKPDYEPSKSPSNDFTDDEESEQLPF